MAAEIRHQPAQCPLDSGNPLIAITMIRHDITAGLFAPVEILVTEKDERSGHDNHLRASFVSHGY